MINPITEIQIIPIKANKGHIAFCSFVLFNSIYCSSVAIYTRPNGLYRLVYPTKQYGNHNLNIFHPINKSFAETIEKAVLAELSIVLKQ